MTGCLSINVDGAAEACELAADHDCGHEAGAAFWRDAICASCQRVGERVRGCRPAAGAPEAICVRCGRPTMGRLISRQVEA